MSERKRAIFVVAALVIGAVGGFYLGGGRSTPGAILENPDLLTAQGNGPVLSAIAGASSTWPGRCCHMTRAEPRNGLRTPWPRGTRT